MTKYEDWKVVSNRVIEVARMIAAAGLVEAFGHVSSRAPGGFVITSTRPFLNAKPEDVVFIDSQGRVIDGATEDLPLEYWMHHAVYSTRQDVGAICRGHPPHCVAWGIGLSDVPLLHGLGLIAGRIVRVHPRVELIDSEKQGYSVAQTLGPESTLLLRGNGGLAVGKDLLEAATRLYYLEERCRVALLNQDLQEVPPSTSWQEREKHTEIELQRACRWFATQFGDLKSITKE